MLAGVHTKRDRSVCITHAKAAASLKGLWLLDNLCQSSRAQETNMKEGAVEEKRG